MNAQSTTVTSFAIEASHPALPGHFPGLPVVPGVVLIDRIIDAAARLLGARVYVLSIQQVKFLRPLLPGETADVTLNFDGERSLRFAIAHRETAIASGMLEVRTGPQT